MRNLRRFPGVWVFVALVFWGWVFLEARVYVVPGHYRTLGQALQAVEDGDTVVVRPGTPEAPMPEVGILQWGGKRVVVGVWPVGTAQPRKGWFPISGVLSTGFSRALREEDQDSTGYWTSQERLTPRDSMFDMMPHPFYDPVRRRYWVVWHQGVPGQYAQFDDVVKWYDFSVGEWSRIYDLTGSEAEGDTYPDFRAYGMVDTRGVVWLSWKRETDNGTGDSDLMYRVYDGTWGPIGYVDSSHYYMSSIYITDAGGEIWAIQNKLIEDPPGSGRWSHETLARRYEGERFGDSLWLSHYGWGTDETVSRAIHDRFGRIHVVWQEYWTAGVFYRQYTREMGWQEVHVVNDTTRLGGSGWGEWVAVDTLTGRIYVVFSGFLKDSTYNEDIYLTWSDDGGGSWVEPVRVNENRAGYDRCPSLVVRDTGDVWVFWDKEFSWINDHVWVRHYGEGEWGLEEQLDDSTAPSLCPWGAVVEGQEIWVTFDGGYGNLVDPPDLWLVRWVPVGVYEGEPEDESLGLQAGVGVLRFWGSGGRRGELRVYDVAGRVMGVLWRGVLTGRKQEVRVPRWPAGVYLVVLQTPGHRRTLKVTCVP